MLLILVPRTVSAEISTVGTPTFGGSYTLMCSVTGLESLNATTNFKWWTSGNLVSSNAVLTFSPLFSSHGGYYTCIARVSSPYLENDFVTSAGRRFTVEGKLPESDLNCTNDYATLIMFFYIHGCLQFLKYQLRYLPVVPQLLERATPLCVLSLE